MTRVRQAVADDIPELVRLRALLFETLGDGSSSGGDWREALVEVLKEDLDEDTKRILVVDGDGGLAACGVGFIELRLPGPRLRNGRLGQVINVITDPAHRRRGHSRAIMKQLLDWFAERDVARVDLHASADGERLYRALGFVDHPEPALYWRP
ncbi:GNAT family N-acetyltransferase [Actinophytocola sp.]|uniref:GNAT family N-acetyltransferase n=1 Tax=Actinophytocola sp. TaxID=1872138 RepID=UPI002ED0CE8C